MTCYNDLIAVRGMSENPADPSLYLDDVGLDRALIEKINYTHTSERSLVESKIDFAAMQISRKILAVKAGELRPTSNIESGRVGYPRRERTEVAAKTGYHAGATIEIRQDSDFVNVYISSISLFVNSTGNIDVLIYDLQTGQLLDTITVAAVAGQMVYKDVDKSYKASRRTMTLAFVYDSDVVSYKTNVIDSDGCMSCGGPYKKVGRYAYAKGVKFDSSGAFIQSSALNESDTAGLSVAYQLHCDYEEWMCKSKNHLLMSVLYATGFNIATYGLNSSRVNSGTGEFRDTLTRVKEWCEQMMNEELNAALSTMIIPKDELCFRCDQRSKHVTTL